MSESLKQRLERLADEIGPAIMALDDAGKPGMADDLKETRDEVREVAEALEAGVVVVPLAVIESAVEALDHIAKRALGASSVAAAQGRDAVVWRWVYQTADEAGDALHDAALSRLQQNGETASPKEVE